MRNGSISSIASSQRPLRPSPLRLEVSQLEERQRRTQSIASGHSVASVGGIGGSYIPPLPSPRSFGRLTPDVQPKQWVSPLDVVFSRPATPKSSAPNTPSLAPALPSLALSGDLEKGTIIPAGSLTAFNFDNASIISNESAAGPSRAPAPVQVPVSIQTPYERPRPMPAPQKKSPTLSVFPPLNQPPSPQKKSPTLSVFPPLNQPPSPQKKSPTLSVFQPLSQPSSPGRRFQRPIFPLDSEVEEESPGQYNEIPIPPIPGDHFHQTPTVPNMDFDNPTANDWNFEKPVIRSSMVSKRTVSVHRPQELRSREASPSSVEEQGVRTHRAASSMYSTMLGFDFTKDNPSFPVKSEDLREGFTSRDSQNQNTSLSHRRSRSAGLLRAQDSIRGHSRKLSKDRVAEENRRSRDRDQLYYNPANHRRNRSGSVQGRKVDFDHPRNSPFSNSYAISSA